MSFDFSKSYPLLPLRDTVVFPFSSRRILVGRDVSLRALEAAGKGDGTIVLVSQRNVEQETLDNPMLDLFSVGVVAHVGPVNPFPNGCVKVILEGLQIVDLRSITVDGNYMRVTISPRKNEIKPEDRTSRFNEVMVLFKDYSARHEIAEGMLDACIPWIATSAFFTASFHSCKFRTKRNNIFWNVVQSMNWPLCCLPSCKLSTITTMY